MASKKSKKYLAILVVILSIIAFAGVLLTELPGTSKFFAAIIVLGITGWIIQKLTKWEGFSGFLMVRSQWGMKFIEKMKRRYGKIWAKLCDVGVVLSFGVFTLFAFKHISKKLVALSLILLIIYLTLVLPYISSILFTLIHIPIEKVSAGGLNEMVLLFFGVILVFGFMGLIVVSLAAKAAEVLYSMIAFLLGETGALTTVGPGVYPVLPYYTIPLVEGIIALILLMVIHEGGHGIISRFSKIKIKSTGILTFGFLPVGAFVDIDEEKIEKEKKVVKSRVFAAGSAANLFACTVFLIPALIILAAVPSFYAEKVIISGTTEGISYTGAPLEVGTQIMEIDGYKINNLTDFVAVRDSGILKPNGTIAIITDKGKTIAQLDEEGKIGVIVSQPMKEGLAPIKFLYGVFGLTAVLNFLIAVVNLLPIPLFDGYRLLRTAVKNNTIVRIIVAVVLLSFLLNIVPWFWQ